MPLPTPTFEQIVDFQKLMREERGVRLTLPEAAEAATELLQAMWVHAHVEIDMEDNWRARAPMPYADRVAGMFPEWDESSLRHFGRRRRPPES